MTHPSAGADAVDAIPHTGARPFRPAQRKPQAARPRPSFEQSPQRHPPGRQIDSNGPAGRIRGTPAQLVERYENLARDAQMAGDTIRAESLWQHAEHYRHMASSGHGAD